MRAFLALLALAAAMPAQGADTYKCRDARGGIVYSNEACDKQGLGDAGPVRDRITTLPALAPAGKPPPKAEKKRAEKDDRPVR